jgi:hypothetical protein
MKEKKLNLSKEFIVVNLRMLKKVQRERRKQAKSFFFQPLGRLIKVLYGIKAMYLMGLLFICILLNMKRQIIELTTYKGLKKHIIDSLAIFGMTFSM